MARSRRLGIAGEVSVWQIPENSVAVSTRTQDFFSRNILDGAFSLWEKRSMIDLQRAEMLEICSIPTHDRRKTNEIKENG